MWFTESIQNIPVEWTIAIVIVAIWDVVWKGIGLWRASERGDKIWFGIMLVLNTAGILPIIYILITNQKSQHKMRM